mgnify:CR=1 FL=1
MSADLTTREWIVQAMYLAASVLFILGLRSLTKPTQARLGMQQAAFGMLFAVIGALLHQEILTYGWIIGGLVIGAIIGYPMAMKVAMTSMPQFVAFSHAFGAIAATLDHARRYADAACAALERGRIGRVYNVADDVPVSQLEFFQWLAGQLRKPLPPFVQNARQGAGEALFGLGSSGGRQGDELASLIYLRMSLNLAPQNALAIITLADVPDVFVAKASISGFAHWLPMPLTLAIKALQSS